MYFLSVFIVMMHVSLNSFAMGRDFPIDISSQSLEVRQTENQALFRGNVKINYGDINLGSDVLDIHYASTGNEDIESVVATGRVVIVHGVSTVTADKAVYTPDLGHVLMTGDIVLTREGSVLKGEKLIYNIVTGDMSMANPEKNGRVKAIFSIKGKD
ncbi:MAG: lipopolysaccharide export system protein LptA [Alphaproteobacteria bacterium]|jgi:lipopolysaccharide export system protein LptA